MSRPDRAPSGALALLVLALASPSAMAAAPKSITGHVNRPGHTVIAIAANGAAASAAAPNGAFRLVPPATTVTLHLRAPDGTYAGPVVPRPTWSEVSDARARVRTARRTVTTARRDVRRARERRDAAGLRKARARLRVAERRLTLVKRLLRDAVAFARSSAVIGIRAGARLGTIRLDPPRGRATARVGRRAWKTRTDPRRTARATRGLTLGNGRNAGLVASRDLSGAAAGDLDRDAVPDQLDVDDDGDLILDDYDGKRSARTAQLPSVPWLGASTSLDGAGAHDATNVNGGSSAAQLAAAQRQNGRLNVQWRGVDPGSAELDCGTLVYCSADGTGRYQTSFGPSGFDRLAQPPFPECCDADRDGLGSLTQTEPPPGASGPSDARSGSMGLFHGASASEIGADDILLARATVNGVPVEIARTVGFVFSTFPVIAAYDDGRGNAATLTYPTGSTAGLPVQPRSDGAYVVDLTLWRPQRARLDGEPGTGAWMDVGHLVYAAEVATPTAPGGSCPQSSYSALHADLSFDPLSAGYRGPPTFGGARYVDAADDRPSAAANTVRFTLNLSDCLASKGITAGGDTTVWVWAFSTASEAGIPMAESGLRLDLRP